MADQDNTPGVDRRTFLKTSAAATAGMMAARGAHAEEAKLDRRHEVDTMPYAKLGRTNFMASQLVFGCGAALAGGKAIRLLDAAYDAGINFYDVGSNIYYRGSERHLAPFFKAHRGEIWVSSKAPLRMLKDHEDGTPYSVEEGKQIAKMWTKLLEASLKDLQTDYMDAYYLMAVGDPYIVRSEELYQAFLDAKEAGKVGHFGLSTHKRADAVLEAAVDVGWYDLAMVAVTPAGWYDWENHTIQEGTPPMTDLTAKLNAARESGIGIVGMKAARHLSRQANDGEDVTANFDEYYSEAQMNSGLNAFQRTYAYVLQHGVDVVNADMQNFKHFQENVAAVQRSEEVFKMA